MTPQILVDELTKVVAAAVSEIVLETPRGAKRAPRVVPGWMPTEDPRKDEDFPYVVVRYIGHEDRGEGDSVAKVNIIAGTHAEDPQGWRDLVNVLECVRITLLKNRVVGKKFRMALPLKSNIPPYDQPYPKWVGELQSEWVIPQLIEEVDYLNSGSEEFVWQQEKRPML